MAAIIGLTVVLIAGHSVLAAEYHEDPETARMVFSGVSLLRYYTDSLDFVLQKEPAEVAARLEKMPFANVPQNLVGATYGFASSAINISHLVVAIDEDLGKLKILAGQFRLAEVIEQAAQTHASISRANSELKRIEQATVNIGQELGMPSVAPGSDLKRSYDGVLARINRIREMLTLYNNLLANLLKPVYLAPEELSGLTDAELNELLESIGLTLEELMDLTLAEPLKPTEITLGIQPAVAFVGDSIRFEGVLVSEKEPLAEREIDILVNSTRQVTVKTDARGYYQGTLPVPYWYLPELNLQALYYPQDNDVGLYLASLSPVTRLKVLFYQAELTVTVMKKAYPGLETTVTGHFDYRQSPLPAERKVEIYFDNILVSEIEAQEMFLQEIEISPETDVGEHIITVSAAEAGRYAPIVASAVLKVSRANPILDLSLPRVVLIPGKLRLEGKLYSEVGALSKAPVKIELGRSQIELVSSRDGNFDADIKMGMDFSLIGSQDLVIQVIPGEPWHSPLNTTSRLVVVNVVNCGGFLVIIVSLGIFLPGRLRIRPGAYPRRAARPATEAALPETPLTGNASTVTSSATEEEEPDSGEPRHRIFYWYRWIVRLILRVATVLMPPQQTLREFAYANSKILGSGAKHFLELTKTVERLLYSQYQPTEEDVTKSRKLPDTTEEGAKNEGV